MKCPCQPSDLNSIGHLWQELKIAGHKEKPSNLFEIILHCGQIFQSGDAESVCKARGKPLLT